MAVHVSLLGTPVIAGSGERYEPRASKASALLYYLACQGQWVSRDKLLFLFWPDTPEKTARSNLRSLLSRSVKGLPYTEDVELDSTRLRWCVPSDLQDFKKALESQHWVKAVQLYGGEFLKAFWLDGALEFGEWLETERRSLHAVWRAAVFKLAEDLEAGGRHEQAAEALVRLCQADAFDEEALKCRLRNLHLSGQRREALDVFDAFKQALERDLDAEPEPETLQLFADIEAAKTPTAPRKTTPQKPRHHLPTAATPFVGRDEERAHLTAMLVQPDCRLVTLVGPGGVGKTRLGLAVARKQFAAFKDGACFVPCGSAREPEQLVYTVADALALPLLGPTDPKRQLLEFLRGTEMLLVLDNLEQLLPKLELVSDVLEAAPNVKVLATSRGRLNLQAEHVFDLFGLSYPEFPKPANPPASLRSASPVKSPQPPLIRGAVERSDNWGDYDAVRLFVQCATRSRSDFVLDASNLQAVVRICRLVEGLPLAIELAASWLRVVSPADIAGEIEKGIEILRAPRQDAPTRHQSIRAVFDYSWRVLTRVEQNVLKKLAVFQGGFAREAAERVAGASLPVLAGLVNKSFLSTTPEGRYRMHPLVQQYLQEKLAERPSDAAATQAAHGAYYTEFLYARREDILGRRQLNATREIAADLDNIRAAWIWVLEHERPQDIYRQARPLGSFYMYQGRYQEWASIFGEAAERLLARGATEQADLALVVLFMQLGWCNIRLGRFDDAEKVLRQAQAVYGRLGIPPVPGPPSDPALAHSLLAWARGDYPTAFRHAEQALLTAEVHGHPHNQRIAHYFLARAAIAQQRFAEGKRHAQRAFGLCEQVGDRWTMSNCHLELGHAAYALGDIAEAQHHYTSSYLIYEEYGDKGGMAEALNELGELALGRGAYAEARDIFQRGLISSRAVHEGKELAKALLGLGDAALALGELEAAPACYHQALEMAAKMRSLALMLPVVQGICHLLSLSGHEERAKHLAAELQLPLIAVGTEGEHHPRQPQAHSSRSIPFVESASEQEALLEKAEVLARAALTTLIK